MNKQKLICVIPFLLSIIYLPAQEYQEAFEKGKFLYEQGAYYDAYTRFNTANQLSRKADSTDHIIESNAWIDKCALGIQQQQQKTDSLLKAVNKLIDAFYFYDDRLALAYKDSRFGFIDKNGEVIIDYLYTEASNFDEETGYARGAKYFSHYWLSPEGIEYSGELPIDSLPKIERTKVGIDRTSESKNKFDSLTAPAGTSELYMALKQGVQHYNNQKFYEAYTRFRTAVAITQRRETKTLAERCYQFRNSSITQIRNLFIQAENALKTANKIRDAFYFYDNKFALAFKNNQYYFIDKKGEAVKKLGRWDKAEQFKSNGFATVRKDKKDYLIDTMGITYQLAFRLADLSSDITALDLSSKSINSFPIEITEYTQLQILILSSNVLDNLPAQIAQLKNLIRLYLSDNQLTSLPPEIAELENLTYLRLSDNQLTSLHPKIGQLENLTYLRLSGNQLTSLPPEVRQLKNLTSLNLKSNQLTSLPPEIGQLTNLTSLNLLGNQLTSLPPEIGQLKNLTSLYLSSYQLTSLPPEIGQLENLTKLYLSGNQLTSLPPEIGQLENLTELYLGNNQLTNLPPEIAELENLTELYLGNNQLTSLPPEIGQLENLTELYLGNNQLTSLPPEIGQLENLTELYLGNNQLTNLPPEIGQLENLTELYLGNNQLTNLPPEIAELENLTNLDLMTNQLTSLPPEIGQLKNLTHLNILYNQLTSLTPEIGQLENLTGLYLGNNQLTSLPPEIAELENLTYLDLMINQLTSLPPEIGQLKNLTHLIILYNQLTSLPPEIAELENLTYLDLMTNQLTSLPPEIDQLQSLSSLDLRRNPFSEKVKEEIKNILPKCEIYFTYVDHFELAQKAFENQNYKAALEAFLKDIEQESSTVIASYGYAGLCYDLLGNPDKALIYLLEYERLVPDDPWTSSQLRDTYAGLEDFPKTYNYAIKATQLDSTNYLHWHNRSWYALFVNKPKDAISAAKKTLELDPKAQSVESNLALGYLLNDQWLEAEAVYLKWKGKKFPGEERLSDEVFLQDIVDLEKAGITHPNFEMIRQLFSKK